MLLMPMGWRDEIEVHEKKCDDLWNQGSEREQGFRGRKRLCGRVWMKKRVELREEGAFLAGRMERGNG